MRHLVRHTFLTLSLGLALLLVHGRADDLTVVRDDWPLFRGNAQQTGVSANSLPKELEIRWTFKTMSRPAALFRRHTS